MVDCQDCQTLMDCMYIVQRDCSGGKEGVSGDQNKELGGKRQTQRQIMPNSADGLVVEMDFSEGKEAEEKGNKTNK